MPSKEGPGAATAAGHVELTMDELREVTRYATGSAALVRDVYRRAHPQDPRVDVALEVAWEFAAGGPRNRRQQQAARDAHRAAKDASTEPARLAARAAGDAAASAYLHPLANANQVGHILRAAACAARIAELDPDQEPAVANWAIAAATGRASPTLIGVLTRYPSPPTGSSRVDQLMAALDISLRARGTTLATSALLVTTQHIRRLT